MKYRRLSPLSVELTSQPDCGRLLKFLVERAGIEILTHETVFLTGDHYSRFKYHGCYFELETIFCDPVLSATECPECVFEGLLVQLSAY